MLQGKVEEMRQRRQTLQKTMMVILSMIVFSMTGCSEKGESVSLTKVEDDSEEIKNTAVEEDLVSNETESTKAEDIYIYVCGEVRNPGVYKLEAGSRINHAIFAAGGMTDAAADTYLNQAELLVDGQKIYVPNKEEVKEQDLVSDGSSEVADDRININTADKSQLTTLSGIGDSRAEAIIAYRETVGSFKTIEEIQKIDGIKEGIFAKIKDKIKVE